MNQVVGRARCGRGRDWWVWSSVNHVLFAMDLVQAAIDLLKAIRDQGKFVVLLG